MRKLKSRRKPRWPGGPILRAYKHRHQLHLHEERVVLALVIERGSGHAIEWEKLEPGRWNLRYLEKVFKRLHGKGLVTRSASYSPFHRRHRFTYHPSVTSKKARAA